MRKTHKKDTIYILIIITLVALLTLTHIDDKFEVISSGDWISLILGLLSSLATIILGIIAIYQTKIANDINNRLLSMEEFENKTFLYFENAVVPIKLTSDEFRPLCGRRKIEETLTIQIIWII